MKFYDILYGEIDLPDWLLPFIKMPEFARLRGIRLSNVDSFVFKDFNGPSRWEHSIAVAYLALYACDKLKLSESKKTNIVLAALLHDVATPPFAHTAEYILEDFDHEIASHSIICGIRGNDYNPEEPIFATQLAKFVQVGRKFTKSSKIKIDHAKVSAYIQGHDDYGWLIAGTMDLDNIDNVLRASHFMGDKVNGDIAYKLVDFLCKSNSSPVELHKEKNNSVRIWLDHRTGMYRKFFQAPTNELGRQAFLQHIMRRALKEGLPRNNLIWNTDSGLITDILNLKNNVTEDQESFDKLHLNVDELIQSYLLFEDPVHVSSIDFDNEDFFKIISQPQAASWIEDFLSSKYLEVMVLVNKKRYLNEIEQGTLFGDVVGQLHIFKLGDGLKVSQFSDEFKCKIDTNQFSKNPVSTFTKTLSIFLEEWKTTRPWESLTTQRIRTISERIERIGSWSFKSNRNQNLHWYPSTFVHALPASLMVALGLKGQRILDPFGGTGQTATEALKLECNVVTSDVNTIALLASNVKFTFINKDKREHIRSIPNTINYSSLYSDCYLPDFDKKEKWFHPETEKELAYLLSVVEDISDPVIYNFCRMTLSAVIPFCSSRSGKSFSYFADNTAFSKEQTHPVYKNAIKIFNSKIKANINIIEIFYADLERFNLTPETTLKRCKVLKCDARSISEKINQNGMKYFDAVITSPPYLCMTDYTLGQRLSYQCLFPDKMAEDFSIEIGARRGRVNPIKAKNNYFQDFARFSENMSSVIRPDGFMALVLGKPKAKDFNKLPFYDLIDEIALENGFTREWVKWRKIHWRRNPGIGSVNSERISIYRLNK